MSILRNSPLRYPMHRPLSVFAVAAVLLICDVVPASAQAPRLKVAATVDTLANGLTLIVHEDWSVPTVATNVWFHVGSGDELPGRTGFAHLFEHLMFMGSEHAPYPQFSSPPVRPTMALPTTTAPPISNGALRARYRSCSGSRLTGWAGSFPRWIRPRSMLNARS
jgi:hypothetical protein